MFSGAPMVSISQMAVCMQTNSIWVPIIAIFVLKQNMDFIKSVCVFLSFIGVILIIDPAILYLDPAGSLSDVSDQKDVGNLKQTMYLGSLFGLLAGFFIGLKRV